MDDRNEFEKTPLEDPSRQNMDEGNELQAERGPLDEPLKRLSISRNQQIPSAFKLGHEGDNVPDHFKMLVNNAILDRWRLVQTKEINPKDFSLENDILCCVVLTIALEEGFRLTELHPTNGFDLRVFRELANMPSFRTQENTYRISLIQNRVPDLQFVLIIIPIGKDVCTFNFMAAGKKFCGCDSVKDDKIELLRLTSTVVPRSGYIEAIDEVTAKISNLSYLADTIRPVICLVMQQVLADRNIELPNSLMGITDDARIHVFKFLTAKDFLSVCSANRYLHKFFRHHEWLWRYFLTRDFGKVLDYTVGCPEMRFSINKYQFMFRKSHEKNVHVQTSSYRTSVPSAMLGRADGRPQTSLRSVSEVEGEPADAEDDDG